MRRDVTDRIADLKQQRNAVVLAHNYQPPEVQDVADFVGDSLGLSVTAARTAADVIVFCGVYFMAETAALLNPARTVLIPDPDATCPMARMVGADDLQLLRRRHPRSPVVCYVNSTAEVKALSDVACTSANAAAVVESLDGDGPVVFVPDRYLARYVARRTGRAVVAAQGYCPTHVRIRPEHVGALRKEHPAADVMVHPECRPEVTALADVVTSTEGMLRRARESSSACFGVGTEVGLLHRLSKENRDSRFIPLTPAAVCPNMKRTTLAGVVSCLERMQPRVSVPDGVRRRAAAAVERMLAVGAGVASAAGAEGAEV